MIGLLASLASHGEHLDVYLLEYECGQCRKYHREGEPDFFDHILQQSFMRVRRIDVEEAILRTALVSHMVFLINHYCPSTIPGAKP